MAEETKGTAPATETPDPGVEGKDELEVIAQKADDEIKAREAAAGGGAAGVEDEGKAKDDEASVEKLRSYMVKHGIQDIGRLVDLATDLESKNTRLSQDVQRLSATHFPIEGEGFVRPPAGPVEEEDVLLPENPIELVTDKAKLAKFVRDLDARADSRAAKRESARALQDAQEQVARKRAENPAEFDRLQETMFRISQRYPRANIDQLFEAAKSQKSNERKALVDEIKRELAVPGGDVEKLKGLAARLRTAPITAGSGVQVDVTKAKGDDAAMLKAIAEADKY